MILYAVNYRDYDNQPETVVFTTLALANDYAACREKCKWPNETIKVEIIIVYDKDFWSK